jgi:hypothetical protein
MNISLIRSGRAVALVLVAGLFTAGSSAEQVAAAAGGAPRPRTAPLGMHEGPPLRDLDFLVNGDFVIEGRVSPVKGGESMPFRGVWTRLADGSIQREFLRLDAVSGEWVQFFVGTSRRPGL